MHECASGTRFPRDGMFPCTRLTCCSHAIQNESLFRRSRTMVETGCRPAADHMVPKTVPGDARYHGCGSQWAQRCPLFDSGVTAGALDAHCRRQEGVSVRRHLGGESSQTHPLSPFTLSRLLSRVCPSSIGWSSQRHGGAGLDETLRQATYAMRRAFFDYADWTWEKGR